MGGGVSHVHVNIPPWIQFINLNVINTTCIGRKYLTHTYYQPVPHRRSHVLPSRDNGIEKRDSKSGIFNRSRFVDYRPRMMLLDSTYSVARSIFPQQLAITQVNAY